MSDRIAIMLDGRIEQLADADTIYDEPRRRRSSPAFIGQQNFFTGTTTADASGRRDRTRHRRRLRTERTGQRRMRLRRPQCDPSSSTVAAAAPSVHIDERRRGHPRRTVAPRRDDRSSSGAHPARPEHRGAPPRLDAPRLSRRRRRVVLLAGRERAAVRRRSGRRSCRPVDPLTGEPDLDDHPPRQIRSDPDARSTMTDHSPIRILASTSAAPQIARELSRRRFLGVTAATGRRRSAGRVRLVRHQQGEPRPPRPVVRWRPRSQHVHVG